MKKTILVIGGTGLLGQPVARHLQEKGFHVRILSRNAEKARSLFSESFEIMEGSITDPASLKTALQGCDGVHISVSGADERPGTELISQLALDFDIGRITYISGATVREENRWFPLIDEKLKGEDAVRKSRVPYTIFCPTWFMDILPNFFRGGKGFTIGKLYHPYHFIAAEDFARMVTNAYLKEEAANKRFFIHGPESMLFMEALEQVRQALYPEVKRISNTPIWMGKLIARFSGNEPMKYAVDLMSYFEKVAEKGDPTEAYQILGMPEITLNQWLKEQVEQKVEAPLHSI
jgi:uncharacterized protein YbjT (DUF2867 family)